MTATPKRRLITIVELAILIVLGAIILYKVVNHYSRIHSRSRSSEARGYLGSYHTALKAHAAEIGCFRGNFVSIGFQPEYDLSYRITAADNANCKMPAPTEHEVDPDCVVTSDACDGAPRSSYKKTWIELPSAVDGVSEVKVTDKTFKAKAAANFYGEGNGPIDEWTINEKKELVRVSEGTDD